MTTVDIPADLRSRDAWDHVWTFLHQARDPSLIQPGALVVAGHEDDPAIALVVDLVPHPEGTIVHLDVLPAPFGSFLDLARRLQAREPTIYIDTETGLPTVRLGTLMADDRLTEP
jgi:hypothetical protein